MLQQQLTDSFKSSHVLDEMSRYHLSAGGKFLRGQLALSEGVVTQTSPEDSLIWAQCCELIHNATLIHDDIQDRDPLRRGQASLWIKYGLEQAINAGDLFIFKAFQKAATLNEPCLIHLLSNCSEILVKGQASEFVRPDPTKLQNLWSDYLETAQGKTSSLFELPIHGIHLLKFKKIEDSLLQSWRDFGVCYQIMDDISDFYGLKQSGQKQKDFQERKVNALIAQLALNPSNAPLIQRYLSPSSSDKNMNELFTTLEKALKNDQVFATLENWIEERLTLILDKTLGETRSLILKLISSSPLKGAPSYEQNARLIST